MHIGSSRLIILQVRLHLNPVEEHDIHVADMYCPCLPYI